MRISDATRPSIRQRALAVLLAFGLAGLAANATAAVTINSETYDWSATLVSFDRAAGTAVLQARFEAHADTGNPGDFAAGDRLTLVWSGRNWAADIRALGDDPGLDPRSLTLPVEYVATVRDGRYLNFRVRVPDQAFAAIEAMDPGMRVTGVSPRSGAGWDTAVLELRHYNDID